MKPTTAPFDIFSPEAFAAAMRLIQVPEGPEPERRSLSDEEMAEGNECEVRR